MYRGRGPPRGGGYVPYGDQRGPPPRGQQHPGPERPYPRPAFSEERGRPRPSYDRGYHHRGGPPPPDRGPPPPDPYRRPAQRSRRYQEPSPGSGGRRGSGDWDSLGPSAIERLSPSPDHGGINTSLVITVGNELTGPPGVGAPRNPNALHDRAYTGGAPHAKTYLPRPGYDGPDDRGPRRRSPSRGRSRPRSRSCSPGKGRSKSRPRSRSCSPNRSRAESRGRSKSRPQSRSPSPNRSRAKSRGRSKSRPRSRSPSPNRGRAKSRGRSKSPQAGRSRSRSGGRSSGQRLSRALSVGRAQSRGRSVGRLKSRSRSVSTSSTSSSRNSSGDRGDGKKSKKKQTNEFTELEMARRRKAMEDMLNMPTKSILKKRLDSETDSPSLKSDSPRGGAAENQGGGMSREAERFISAMKGMEPNMLASMLGELREDPHDMHRPDSSGLSGILGLLAGAGAQQQQEERRKKVTDIDDEEKFLYGDEEPERARSQAPADRVTEAALYGDFTLHRAVDSPRLQSHAGTGDHTTRGPQQQQADIRYQSRSSVTPDQSVKVVLPNYPPRTDPQEEKDVDEYEKIQDLLKTIGLDLGVTEISKMAARTQERLHGKRAPSKTASHRPEKRERRNSSGSSDRSSRRRRSRSRSHSGSRSSDSSHSRSRSRSSSLEQRRNPKKSPDRRNSNHGKSRGGREVKTDNVSRGIPVLGNTASQTPETPVMASHSALSMPPYPQTHGLVPPNYPPPGYGQYGNYMPYMAQQWPMYPPPSIGMPPPSPIEDFQNAPPFDRSYGSSKMAPQDNGRESSKAGSHHERRVLEEKNNESQKQKVLEERENLRGDRDIRMKKKEYLMKELERLRKQQGELLRKKRREKDGHKDPLLSEISRLQEEVMSQISVLRKEHEDAEKKRSELDKVALILGLCATDKPRRESRASVERVQPPPPEQEKKPERARSPGKSLVDQSSTATAAALSSRSPETWKQNVPASAASPVNPELFEYYDAGNHWCKNCNITSGSMFDFFTHLHSKTHRKTQDVYNRPWAPSITKIQKNYLSTEKMVKPIKGSEFLLPVKGFYCQLCEEFYGDAICAEDHVTSHAHNEKYKKQIYECPLYEKRRNLDRQAALSLEASDKKHTELKRKHEEEHKNSTEKEGKPKHSKKEKKDKERDEKSKNKEEEEKPNYSKTEVEESPVFSKRNEEERHKYNKREEADRYKHSKDEEDRSKHSKREEEDKYKYSKEEERYTNRREEDEERSRYGRVEERSRNIWRDDDEEEERSRYSKGKEPKSKYNRKEEERYRSEKEEGKCKKDDRQSKKFKGGRPREEEKSGSRKQPEPAERYVEPPRVFSGPSLAMRAKMRKKSEETGKGGAVTPTIFGKFSWKKKENDLAKEAERVAADFLRDDEVVNKGNDGNEDSFSKSLAVAKNIAIKLSGKTVIPPTKTWLPYHSDHGKIRPDLPAPTKVLRKSPWVYAKPAPLNAFLSITPTVGTGVTPLPVIQNQPEEDYSLPANIISKAFGGEEVVLNKPQDQDTGESDTTSTSMSVTLESSLPTAAATFTKATAPEPNLTMSVMTYNESDVAAPGVPESEQNLPVLVHPPPFMNKPPSEIIHKSEKPKSNLAAAKAQDLYDIFYCNSTTSSTSTATKPAMDPKPEVSDPLNCETLRDFARLCETLPPQTTEPLITPAPETTNCVEMNTGESERSEDRVELQPKEELPEAAPEALPEAAPEELPEAAPEELPEAAPEALPEAAPEELPEAAPEELPEAAPEALPEAAPEELPEAAPEALPEAAPEALDNPPDELSETPPN